VARVSRAFWIGSAADTAASTPDVRIRHSCFVISLCVGRRNPAEGENLLCGLVVL